MELQNQMIDALLQAMDAKTKQIGEYHQRLVEKRDDLRNALKNKNDLRFDQWDTSIPIQNLVLEPLFGVDGARVTIPSQGSALSVVASARVSTKSENDALNGSIASIDVIPHIQVAEFITRGIMAMTEILLLEEGLGLDEKGLALMDGGRISALISINMFYEAMAYYAKELLEKWRKDPSGHGYVLQRFESCDVFSKIMSSDRIIGHLKLVSTQNLVRKIDLEEMLGLLEDQGLVNLLLDYGESIDLPYETHGQVLHVNRTYPYHDSIHDVVSRFHENAHPFRLHHLYAKTHPFHGVYKIEVNQSMLNQTGLESCFKLWQGLCDNPEIESPMPLHIADMLTAQVVSTMPKVYNDRIHHELGQHPWARPYRSH